MGKLTWHGLAKLGETGQSGGAFITGANLASALKRKPKPREEPDQGELDLEPKDDPDKD